MKWKTSNFATASIMAVCGLIGLASAQTAPQLAQLAPPIAPPKDIPCPGVIWLAVDATDLPHAIFSVREVVPVQRSGPTTLLYPKWVVGNHAPSGPIDKLSGLIITANGKRIEWKRDPVDMYAFHVTVPARVSALDVEFQFLSPVSTRDGHVVMTPEILDLQWHTVLLYPAGYFSRQIRIDPTLKLPPGFVPVTALTTASSSGNVVTYKTTTLNTLIDSPVIAGKNSKSFDLDPGGPARVTLDVIADKPSELDATSEQIAAHKALVQQAYKLFGSHHYDHYDFLLYLSDKMSGVGREHHQSSEDGTIPNYFTGWDTTPAGRDLLAHEFAHSWNGKFRRPADLWTPNYEVPMRDSLLWVYEGQTDYWGYVLAARSGLLTKQQTLDSIALIAANMNHRPGRAWRSLEDTTNDPIISNLKPQPWLTWQREEDYYSECSLVWLDVDTLMREKSGGKRSLDDFAKAFFGVENGSFVTVTYTFDDVVKVLNSIEPYDWAMFLRRRLENYGPAAPLDGVARGGYRLVYDNKPSEYQKSADDRRKGTVLMGPNLMFSIGMILNRDGVLTEVLWDGPAFKAGLTVGTQLVAVNGGTYNADDLKDAIENAKGGTASIELLVKNKEQYRTVRVDYHDGLRYPHLERIADVPARLDDILEAKK